MAYWRIVFLAVLHLAACAAMQSNTTIPLRVINSDTGRCPLQEEVEAAISAIRNDVSKNLMVQLLTFCGPGQWYRVAHLNMSNPSQHCPSAWREVTSGEIRLCARPSTTSQNGSCPGTRYPVSDQYSKVCGRVIGYQFNTARCVEESSDISLEVLVHSVWTYIIHCHDQLLIKLMWMALA